jgi:hypothetical protein
MTNSTATTINGRILKRTDGAFLISACGDDENGEFKSVEFWCPQTCAVDLQLGKMLVADWKLNEADAMFSKHVEVECKPYVSNRCGCCQDIIEGNKTKVDNSGEIQDWCDWCVEQNMDEWTELVD